jgi:hypothetical protein
MDISWKNLPENFNPEEYVGFVYKITHLETGKYYIGKKFFWKVLKRPPLKGKKNKRHEKQPSDWRDYWGSSEELLKDIEKFGKESFKREVLFLTKSKWDCAYEEARLQMESRVLFDPKSYNGIINIRLKKFLKKQVD